MHFLSENPISKRYVKIQVKGMFPQVPDYGFKQRQMV